MFRKAFSVHILKSFFFICRTKFLHLKTIIKSKTFHMMLVCFNLQVAIYSIFIQTSVKVLLKSSSIYILSNCQKMTAITYKHISLMIFIQCSNSTDNGLSWTCISSSRCRTSMLISFTKRHQLWTCSCIFSSNLESLSQRMVVKWRASSVQDFSLICRRLAFVICDSSAICMMEIFSSK